MAVATAVGEAGVGIVRLSGPDVRAIGTALLRRPRGRSLRWQSHRMIYGHIVDPATGQVIDEVLACYMAPPRTFTGEDVLEIYGHGGRVVLSEIVRLCCAHGARIAHRGEFTQRAFLSGRVDLAQAEAVLDVVRARTPTALHLAVAQLGGELGKRILPVADRLLTALAHLEALIDFVDDEIPVADVASLTAMLASAATTIDAILATADRGIALRDGVRVALVGKPNVGKSSILNGVLRLDRAIVTPIAGTTRDTLEEAVTIAGIQFVLTDTAGIADTTDPLEALGVERSRAVLAAAPLVIWVCDGSHPLDSADRAVATALAVIEDPPRLVIAINKSDLPPALTVDDIAAALGPPLSGCPMVRCSAVGMPGLHALEDALHQAVPGGSDGQLSVLDSVPLALIDRQRHRAILERAAQYVAAAHRGFTTQVPLELVCIDLRSALHALDELTGRAVDEDVLDRIFAEFCIGK